MIYDLFKLGINYPISMVNAKILIQNRSDNPETMSFINGYLIINGIYHLQSMY